MRAHRGIRLCGLAAGIACAVGSASPAQAAFPGANGAIVFASTMDGDSDIYAVASDGSALRNITSTPRREQQPSVSADGSRVAYKTAVSSPRDEESWVSGFDGTAAHQVTDTPGELRFSTQPAWSPGGDRLLVRSNRDAGHYDVWSVRSSDGGDPVQLTQDAADDRYPALSPDGKRIVFRSDRGGDPDIWVMDSDGSNAVDLTAGTGLWESAPAWSPDGRRIAFERVGLPGDPDVDATVATTDEIWTMAADGSSQRRLTDNAAHDEGPGWSPDGTQIVFTSAREEPRGDIWLMAADGSQQRRLFGTPATEESPDWQAVPLPAPVVPAPVPPVPPVPAPAPPPPPPSRPLLAGAAAAQAVRRSGLTTSGLKVRVSCNQTCSYDLSITAANATARRLKLTASRTKAVILGSRTGTARSRATTVTVKLSQTSRRALLRLKRKSSVVLVLKLRARTGGGAAATHSYRLTVKT